MSRWRPVLLTAAWTSETSPLDPRPARPSSYGRIVTSEEITSNPATTFSPVVTRGRLVLARNA